MGCKLMTQLTLETRINWSVLYKGDMTDQSQIKILS